MDTPFSPELILSAASLGFTAYFWMVQSRRERPNLEFYQLADFRMSLRKHPQKDDVKRLCLQQLNAGGVLIVNHSTRQNSVVLFDCYLSTYQGRLRGDWGFSGEDRPPWNVGPESSIAFSPACFFDVPADFELPDELEFQIHFITASGAHFTHRFFTKAPDLRHIEHESRAA